MKAVILAAGKGTRLLPLTEKTHKVLLPLGNRPILEYSIKALAVNKVDEVLLVLNYKKEDIEEYFGDGSKFRTNISYLYQENPKGGTADAVGYARGKIDGKFIVLNGDIFFHPSIVKKLKESRLACDGLVACKEVKNPQKFGVLVIERDRIRKIVEKSPNPPSNIANLGIYLLPDRIFEAIDHTCKSERGEKELTDSINYLLDKGFVFRPIFVDEFWIDIGTVSDYKRAKLLYEKWKKEQARQDDKILHEGNRRLIRKT